MFSNQIEDSDNPDHNSNGMELKSEHSEPTITVVKPLPPSIFIRTLTKSNTFFHTFKKATRGEQSSCESSINGAKLSTHSADSYWAIIQYLRCNNEKTLSHKSN